MGARGGGPQLVAPDVSSAHVLVWLVRGFFGRRLLFCLARAHFFGSSRVCCCGSLVSVSYDEERRERGCPSSSCRHEGGTMTIVAA